MSGQQGNPAWKTILDKIPPEFHNQILPDLQSWDQGVQKRFEEIHKEYEEYKKFKPFIDNNIEADYAWQSVVLADNLQRDPEKVISQMNETWELGFVSKDEAAKLGQSAGNSTDSDDFLNDEDDILNNPKVKAMYDSLTKLQTEYESDKERQQREREEAEALNEFEQELDTLEAKCKEDNLPFHRTFVTALIAQGVESDEALKQYHQIVAGTVNVEDENDESANNGEQPPVVMGNGGSVGSGSADGSVDYAKLNTSDFNDTIEQILARQLGSGQG